MIFQADAIELIKDRRKTQTRRPVKCETECRYRIGRTYSVQPGRGQRGVFDITIMSVRQEKLGEISQQDVQREGFRFPAQFMARWKELHGSTVPDVLVWVITFAVGDLTDRFDTPRLLAATPGAIRFEKDRHGRQSITVGTEEHQDYVEHPRLAMAREPEAVAEVDLKVFVRDAHLRDDARKRAERAEMSVTERVKDIERAALAGDQQAKRHLHLIGQRVRVAEQKRPRKDAA